MINSKVWLINEASRGLGLNLVRKLLERGYRVAATSRDVHGLSRAVGIIDKERFITIAVDMGNPDCLEDSIQQTLKVFGRIDVMVNNCGYAQTRTWEELDEKVIKDIFDLNVFAVFSLIKGILPIMRKQRAGHIINIDSEGGFAGSHGSSVYTAAKAAIAGFSEVIALEVEEYGIHVTTVMSSVPWASLLTTNLEVRTIPGTNGFKFIKTAETPNFKNSELKVGFSDYATNKLIEISENPQPPRVSNL